MERMKFMKYWRNLIYTPCGFDIIYITKGVNSSNFCTLTKKLLSIWRRIPIILMDR